MSWFTDFLTDVSRQAAPGIQQGIVDAEKRKLDLESMRQTIPILVEQQKALLPGEIEKARSAASEGLTKSLLLEDIRRRNRLELEDYKNKGKGSPTDILGFLSSKVEVPTDPSIQSTQPRSVNYGAGEEAMGGMVPTTTQEPASNVLLRAINLDPKQYTMVPHWSATGGVSMGPQQRPVGRVSNEWEEYNEPGTGRRMRYNKQTGERTEVSGAVKTAQPFTEAAIAGMLSGAIPLPEGVTRDQVLAARNEFISMQGAKTGARTGAAIDAKAERAQKLGEIKIAEELAKRDPRIIQRDLDKIDRVQQITLKYAPEIEKAKNLSRPMGETAQTQMRLFENTLRSLDQMRREFSDDDLLRYAGIWNRGENYIAQVAGVDQKFQRFLVLNEHLRSTAFQYGGKQLTPFEASVVFGFTPHGREIFKEQYLEKMNLLEERTHFELGRVRDLATTPKRDVVPVVPPGTQQRLGGRPTQSADPMEGRTATNPQTGQKLIRRNGRWEPVK